MEEVANAPTPNAVSSTAHLSRTLQPSLEWGSRWDFVVSRWCKVLIIGLLLASCSSVLFASHTHDLQSVLSVVGNSRSLSRSSESTFDGLSSGDISGSVRDGRQLTSEEHVLENVGELVNSLHDRVDDLPQSITEEGIVDNSQTSLIVENDHGSETNGTDDNANERHVVEDSNEGSGNSKPVLKGLEKLLDGLEDDVDQEDGGGIFNKTITEQEGILETVARVGKHSDDDEEEEDIEESGLQVTAGKTETEVNETARYQDEIQTSQTHQTQDVQDDPILGDTWFDRIMGRDQENMENDHETEDMVSAGKDSHRIDIDPELYEKKNMTKEKPADDGGGRHQVEDVPRLIDREDNEYVISNPGKNSQMKLQEDLTLISDIVIIIVAAAVGGTFCGYFGQPVILGYLAAGMVVGPGGLRLIHELVQVETLAQFGVVFLLFSLGVEFNASKMQGVHGVALGGGCIQIGTAMLLGGFLSSSAPQGVFIGAFLSMSSTAVVVKCLADANMSGTEHGQIMLGTLLLQDFALGLLLAVMPALAAKESSPGMFAVVLSREGMLLLGFCGAAWIISKLFIPHYVRTLVRLMNLNSELYQLGTVGLCLLMAFTSHSLGLSMEVGAFISGLMFSGVHTEKTLHQVEPIRNIFAALFLASIGMVMHPIFLWHHKDILLASLGVVFFGKACLVALVVRAFGYNSKTALSVGIALAQIGEFAFILLSRAQSLGLVSKKLYLLLMGTSALSLVLTPVTFKIVNALMASGGLEKKGRHAPLRKTFSKPYYSFLVPYSEQPVKEFTSNAGSEDVPETLLWSNFLPDENALITNSTADESVCDVHSSVLTGQGLDLQDVEDGRGDRQCSPPRVLLRRPFSQVLSENWKEDVRRDLHRR